MDDVKQLDRAAGATYEADFYAWAMDQAARVRAAGVPGLDVENIAEELESLGRSQRAELSSRCDVLLTHLLKWRFQPTHRGSSLLSTIGEQRRQIDRFIKDSPSLRRTLPDEMVESYRYAVKQAARETSLPRATFAAVCPWTPAQVLDEEWLPGEAGEADG